MRGVRIGGRKNERSKYRAARAHRVLPPISNHAKPATSPPGSRRFRNVSLLFIFGIAQHGRSWRKFSHRKKHKQSLAVHSLFFLFSFPGNLFSVYNTCPWTIF